MKRILTYLFLLITYTSFSQNADSTRHFNDFDRLRFGFELGNNGLSFGSNTSVEISPFVSYNLNNKISVGVGGIYNYYNSRYYNYETNVYGGRIFGNITNFLGDGKFYLPNIYFSGFDFGLSTFELKNVFIRGEYDVLSLESKYFAPSGLYQSQDRFLSSSFLVGVGVKEYFNDRFCTTVTLLFNVNAQINIFYSNPTLRFGFEF